MTDLHRYIGTLNVTPSSMIFTPDLTSPNTAPQQGAPMETTPPMTLRQTIMNAKRTLGPNVLFIGNLPGTQWRAVAIGGKPEITFSGDGLCPRYLMVPLGEHPLPHDSFYPEHAVFLLGNEFQLMIRVGFGMTDDGRLSVTFRNGRNDHTEITRTGRVTTPLMAADADFIAHHVHREFLRHLGTLSNHLQSLHPQDYERMSAELLKWTS